MKKRTIYTLPKDTEPTGDILASLIKRHKNDITTFKTLESYMDDNPVMSREAPNDLLTIHNYAQYITSINNGYLLGNPVDYRAEDAINIDPIIEHYSSQTISELDSDIGEDLSMFGQAFENVFIDETPTVLSAKLSVYNTIVVYDDTFKHNKMFAVYYSPQANDKGQTKEDAYDLTIWTKSHIFHRQLIENNLTEIAGHPDTEHFFGEVPVVHYMNNKRMKGDYEPVISLIDAYNILQSDRVLDREKLVDAILAFYGAKLPPEDQQAIKDNRVVGLPEGSKAEFIVKQIDEADADVLRKTIAADIHKFSMTPDLTDETFGNSPSGVSILYKLLAFEQNIKGKERHFTAGLKNRLRLYSSALAIQSKLSAKININSVTVIYKRSLPKNDFETSQMIANLEGTVDQETLVGQLSFVDDASKVVEKVEAEQEKRLAKDNFATSNFPSVDEG